MAEPVAERLFFALRPPPDAIAAIGQARAEAGLAGKPIPDERLHLTLFLFDDLPVLPPALIAAARAAAGAVEAAPFRMILDTIVLGGNSLLLPSEPVRGLEAFQARLAAALTDAGLGPRADWRFRPHVTLGHRDPRRGAAAIDPIGWTAETFVLIRSFVGRGRHELLAEFALARRSPR